MNETADLKRRLRGAEGVKDAMEEQVGQTTNFDLVFCIGVRIWRRRIYTAGKGERGHRSTSESLNEEMKEQKDQRKE